MVKSLLLVALASLFLSQVAVAAIVRFDVPIDGTQSGTGSPGTGSATAFLDDVSGVMSISGSYTGLNGNVTVSHLHGLTMTPGTGDAGILITLTNTGDMAGTFSGSGTLDAAQVTGAVDGRTYINIHSSTNGAGEIRGFLSNSVAVPEPGSLVAISLCFAGAAIRRRR